MNKILLDANAILRYLLDDHEQNQKVTKIIGNNSCHAILSTIQEVVYVLEGYYKVPREEITEALYQLKDAIHTEDEDVYLSSLQFYNEPPKPDYADCIMCGYYNNRGVDILTYDKTLKKKLMTI